MQNIATRFVECGSSMVDPTEYSTQIDRKPPNEAMKRTSLSIIFFACAKKPPPAVGRLSRR
jgi:hypothetical protein